MKSIIKSIFLTTVTIIGSLVLNITLVDASTNVTSQFIHDDWYIALPQTGATSSHEPQNSKRY